jgi:zinc transporter ZupT
MLRRNLLQINRFITLAICCSSQSILYFFSRSTCSSPQPFVVHLSQFFVFLALSFFIMFLPQVFVSNAHDTEHPEGPMANAMGEEALNVEKEYSADQQVQRLSHFLSIPIVSLFFYLCHFL